MKCMSKILRSEKILNKKTKNLILVFLFNIFL